MGHVLLFFDPRNRLLLIFTVQEAADCVISFPLIHTYYICVVVTRTAQYLVNMEYVEYCDYDEQFLHPLLQQSN